MEPMYILVFLVWAATIVAAYKIGYADAEDDFFNTTRWN